MLLTLRIFIFLSFAFPITAAPINYSIQKNQSNVSFSYIFSEETIKAIFLKYEINLQIDFDNVQNSQINVILDATQINAGFPFANIALKSKQFLNTKEYPIIVFTSNKVTAHKDILKIEGVITIKGHRRPLTLNAQLFRPKGNSLTDRKSLRIILTGHLNRHDFNVSGYKNTIDSILKIHINAKIFQNEIQK